MTTDLALSTPMADTIERVVLNGDLSKLSAADRVSYYRQVCESLGLNPLTRPFDYLSLQGKLILYARKDATEQLRKRDGVSVTIPARELVDGVYVVTARATTATGRTDESIGAVAIEGLKGEARANAMMKAESKAKRRVTLSVVGLGWLDETEVSSIPDARPVAVDTATGEILDSSPPPPPATNGKALPPKDTADAERRFFAKFGTVVGGTTWWHVQEYLGHSEPQPATVEDWISAAQAVRDRNRTMTEALVAKEG